MDEVEHDREICNKKDCNEYAAVVLKIYTEEGQMHVAGCLQHLFTMSGILERIAQSMMTGDYDKD